MLREGRAGINLNSVVEVLDLCKSMPDHRASTFLINPLLRTFHTPTSFILSNDAILII